MSKMMFPLLLLCCGLSTYAQSSRELCAQAVTEMEKKNYDLSMELLQKAERIAPQDATPPYEMGMIFYLQKKYTEALPFFRKALNGNYVNITDLQYAMLGNCYDLKTDSVQAVKSYEEGRKRFPATGRLWTEEGNLHFAHRNYDKGLCCYETSIKTDPAYASAYRNAATIWSMTDERFHCMMFAELFMNIEPGGQRNEDMSKLLYNTVNEAVVFTDTSANVTLTKNMNALIEGKEIILPQAALYEMGFMVGFAPILIDRTTRKDKSKLKLAEIVQLYTSGNEKWFSQKSNKKYRNTVMERQQKLADQKILEAYIYWLFRAGDPAEFSKWLNNNQQSFEALKKWFSENKFSPDKNNIYQSGYACH